MVRSCGDGPAPADVFRDGRRGAAFRPSGRSLAHDRATVVATDPRTRSRARGATVRALAPPGPSHTRRLPVAARGPIVAARHRSVHQPRRLVAPSCRPGHRTTDTRL